MEQQIIDLWKISFGDTDDFIRLWFDRVYKDENTFTIEKNGRIVSALQILPYEMTYCGTIIPAGYICGVCTLPSERGKGFMNQLMLQALEEMRNRKYALVILIPATHWLFDYYRRFEFADAFDYSIEEIYGNTAASYPDSGIRIISQENFSVDTMYAYYHLKQRERDCSVLHSAYQFETVRRDWNLAKGEIWMAFKNEQPAGLAFSISKDHETVSIREILYDCTEVKNALVQCILNHYQLPKAALRLPPTPSNSVPYGMARIINKAHMIELYRSFHNQPPLPDYKNKDIPTLTQILLKYEQRQAFMNLMLD